MNITDIVKNNIAEFNFYRGGKLYYTIRNTDGVALWEFPIDVTDTNDIGNAVFGTSFKAITLMRYIRKAIASESLVEIPH